MSTFMWFLLQERGEAKILVKVANLKAWFRFIAQPSLIVLTQWTLWIYLGNISLDFFILDLILYHSKQRNHVSSFEPISKRRTSTFYSWTKYGFCVNRCDWCTSASKEKRLCGKVWIDATELLESETFKTFKWSLGKVLFKF